MNDIQTLKNLLRQQNPLARRAAIEKLGEIPSREALNLLLWSYKNDPDQHNRQLAHVNGKRLYTSIKANTGRQPKKTTKPSSAAQRENYFSEDDFLEHEDIPDRARPQESTSVSRARANLPSSSENNSTTMSRFSLESTQDDLFVTREQELYEPLFPREKPPEPVNAKKKTPKHRTDYEDKPVPTGLWGWIVRRTTLTETIIWAILPAILGTIFFFNFVTYTNWIDLSYVPLENGSTFRQFFISAQKALEPYAHENLQLFQPGIDGGSVAKIFAHEKTIADGIYKWDDIFRERLRLPIPTSYYPETPSIFVPDFDLYIIIATVIFTLGSLSIASQHPAVFTSVRTRHALGLIPALMLRAIPQFFTPKLVWFILFIFSLVGLAFVGYFFMESEQLSRLAVNNLGLAVSPSYVHTRQLGLGFVIALGSTIGAVISTLIGMIKSPFFL